MPYRLDMDHAVDIFAAFASAEALGRAIGVRGVTVRQWKNRGHRIPPKYWAVIKAEAENRGYNLPLEAFLPTDDASMLEPGAVAKSSNSIEIAAVQLQAT